MYHYETKLMDKSEFAEFIEFFNTNIGTDYDINEDPAGSDKVYVVCFELTHQEANQIRKFENRNS